MLLQSCLPCGQSCLTCGHSWADARDSVMRSRDSRAALGKVGTADSHWVGRRMHGLLQRKQPHQQLRAQLSSTLTQRARASMTSAREGRQPTPLHVYSGCEECSERKEAGEWCIHRNTHTVHGHTYTWSYTANGHGHRHEQAHTQRKRTQEGKSEEKQRMTNSVN